MPLKYPRKNCSGFITFASQIPSHPPRRHISPKRLVAIVVEDLRAAFHALAGDKGDLLRSGAPDLQGTYPSLLNDYNQDMNIVYYIDMILY